jgi:hypothetical protein
VAVLHTRNVRAQVRFLVDALEPIPILLLPKGGGSALSFECEAVLLFDNSADAMGPRCYWQHASLLTRSVAVQLRAVPLVRLWCSGNTLACHAGIASSNLARCSRAGG